MRSRVFVLLVLGYLSVTTYILASEGEVSFHPLEVAGVQHLVDGRIPEAIELLQRALFWTDDPVAEARISMFLGICFRGRDRGESLAYLERVERLCESEARNWEHCGKSRLSLSLGRMAAGMPLTDPEGMVREALGEYGSSVATWLKDLVKLRDSEEPFRDALEVMSSLGVSEELIKFLEDAEALQGKVVSEHERSHLLERVEKLSASLEEVDPQGMMPGHLELLYGMLASIRRDFESGKAHFSKGAEIASSKADLKLKEENLKYLAAIHWELGEVDTALQVLERAIQSGIAFERQLLEKDALTATLQQGYTQSVEQLIQYLAWSRRPASAFGRAEALKVRNLTTRLAGRELGTRSSAAELKEFGRRRRDLRQLETQVGKESDLRQRDKLREELYQRRRQYLGLLMRQRIRSPVAVGIQNLSEEIELRQARRWLPERGTTLVSYYSTWKELLIWVVDQDRFEMASVEIPRKELQAKIRPFLTQLTWNTDPEEVGRGAQPLPVDSPVEGLEETLYRLLISPVRSHLRNRRLILVPHSSLHNLPFAALRNPETDRYLVEEFILSNAPSVQTLGSLRSRGKPVAEQATLVVGDPATRLPSLPGAKREARRVAEVLGTTPLLGSAAMESTVRRRLPDISWLHIATHGVYVEDNPYFSRLELTPDREESGADGHLEIHEILTELDFEAVQMVVLSGCETALGEITRGDEIVGLARAFLYAGSPAVVSTLWSVDDEASGDLMEHFYRQLQAEAPVDEALRAAQLRLLAQEETRHPFYWAGYVVEGDAGRRWSSSDVTLRRR